MEEDDRMFFLVGGVLNIGAPITVSVMPLGSPGGPFAHSLAT